ncbi:MAG TPA: hypothetical protein VEU62_13380 [Bryobacterales bacterium]|nr:hypothetical protein [Bryobacterales bacterium]
MDTPIPGPDGFLLSADDPLRAAHLRLNDYLLAEEQRNTALTPFDVAPWRKLPKRQLVDQVQAVLQRLAWLDQHDAELENAHLARLRLATLLRVLHSIKVPYTEPDLCALLDLTTTLLGRIAPYGPVDRVLEYCKDNDLTPKLCRALRHFQGNLREEMSESQASMQSLRQCLHMLLWLDEWEPLDPARCWSECIRRDFRAMTGDRRVKWRALLKHLRGNAPVRMPAGWARQAEPLLAAVGLDDFREQIHLWFAPFRSGEALPLSVAGSYVLKCLIWYCAVARDEDLKQCALWLLDVKWKQKRNTEKAMVALGQFGVTKESLRERNLIPPPPPDPTPRLIEKMLQATCLVPANHIQMDPDGELIVIQGQLHFYRLFRSTGRIERVTDNAVLELHWPAISDQFRLLLHRQCDSPQQLDLRAWMLMNDGVFGRCFAVAHPK